MYYSNIYIINLIFILLVGCSPKSGTKNISNIPDRVCDCSKLLTRQDHGFYLQYHEGEDTFYTGKCKFIRENGTEILYKYVKGHILEQIETYPGGILNEELYYDTTGRFINRARYFPNGHKSYQAIFGDHTYETFYENGKIQRKGGYGFTKEDIDNKYYNLDKVRLYDSIWKQDGSFDTVYHYSKGSITY
jgi:hypothetical protein